MRIWNPTLTMEKNLDNMYVKKNFPHVIILWESWTMWNHGQCIDIIRKVTGSNHWVQLIYHFYSLRGQTLNLTINLWSSLDMFFSSNSRSSWFVSIFSNRWPQSTSAFKSMPSRNGDAVFICFSPSVHITDYSPHCRRGQKVFCNLHLLTKPMGNSVSNSL